MQQQPLPDPEDDDNSYLNMIIRHRCKGLFFWATFGFVNAFCIGDMRQACLDGIKDAKNNIRDLKYGVSAILNGVSGGFISIGIVPLTILGACFSAYEGGIKMGRAENVNEIIVGAKYIIKGVGYAGAALGVNEWSDSLMESANLATGYQEGYQSFNKTQFACNQICSISANNVEVGAIVFTSMVLTLVTFAGLFRGLNHRQIAFAQNQNAAPLPGFQV